MVPFEVGDEFLMTFSTEFDEHNTLFGQSKDNPTFIVKDLCKILSLEMEYAYLDEMAYEHFKDCKNTSKIHILKC